MSSEARELRRQIGDWREGRADKSLLDALSDAYIGLFAVVMLGAMAVNVVRQTRTEATASCTTGLCADGRNVLPWLFAAGVVTVALLIARLFGPLLTSPAEVSWLLSSPVDRRGLLRPRLIAAAAITLGVAIVLGAVDFALGGFGVGPAVALTVTFAATALGAVMYAAIDQVRDRRTSQIVSWVLATAVWVGLLLLALGKTGSQISPVQHLGVPIIVVAVALVGLAMALTWRASARSGLLGRDRLTAGGSLLSSLSGAFASLDLNLMYDIMMSRRWLQKATVRPVRGGPAGAWIFVWRDVIRLRRSVHTLVLLGASIVLPYVASAVGLGKAVTLVAALTGFLAGLGLCSGLRVLVRTPGLIRCFPMSAGAVQSAGLVVPAVILLLWGIGTGPAMHHALAPLTWSGSFNVGFSVGLIALTAVARWIMAAPPDYSAPLLTSPAGAIPPSLFGNLIRGLDVLLLLTAPLLLASPETGAFISNVLAVIVLAVLLNKPPKQP